MSVAINKRGPLQSRAALKSYQAGSPMEKVHLNFLGLLPRTKNGNEYILTMVDSFTKWVECVPPPSQTAGMTPRAVINDFFSRFGNGMKCLQIRVKTLRVSYSAECARLCGSTKPGQHRTERQGMVNLRVTTERLWMGYAFRLMAVLRAWIST